jgi:hypothetical protein
MGWWQWTLIAIAVLAAVVGHLEMIEAPPERGLNHLVGIPRWAMRASIPRPPRCERGALPTELNARGGHTLATPRQVKTPMNQQLITTLPSGTSLPRGAWGQA